MDVLFTLIGNRDPYTIEGGEEYGPVLSLLQARSFGRVYLFYTGSSYLERARTVEEIGKSLDSGTRFYLVNVDLVSPVDYEEVFAKLAASARNMMENVRHLRPRIHVLLDPGTPQMQTAWFLIVRSRMLEATLLQGVPARFAGGSYKVKEVILDQGILPEIRIPAAVPGARKSQAAERSIEQQDQAGRWYSQPASANIIGENTAFQRVLQQAMRIANYDISVLILGETGTGKGLIARLIHESSNRRNQPFVSINCAAVTASLVESELFGHAKGAFTGASTERMGLFRSADGGTIFLDEIGDLPLDIQPKLLRVLEEHTIVPVGEDGEISVDVRVIAATNKNLESLIGQKGPAGSRDEAPFRRDLFERLNQLTINLPLLRDRPEDIPLLIRHYLDDWNNRYHEQKVIDQKSMDLLLRYSWPGNVRELANTVTGMCATSLSDTIVEQLIPRNIVATLKPPVVGGETIVTLPDEGINLPAYLHSLERQYYHEALERSGGNGEQAAKLLGVNGPAFRKAMRERFGEQ